MPRTNDKPFPCEDCRFNIDDHCRRNPPAIVENVHYTDSGHGLRAEVHIVSHYPNTKHGCFAGEPLKREYRSCNNCGRASNCKVNAKLWEAHFIHPVGWHCSDWQVSALGPDYEEVVE
jgi:hypothetical protein